MIVCRQCGERNEAGAQFCGACGAFLEWEGTATAEARPAVPPTEPRPAARPEAPAPRTRPAGPEANRPTWNFTRPEPRPAPGAEPRPAGPLPPAPDAPPPSHEALPASPAPAAPPPPPPAPAPDQWTPAPVRPTERQPTDEPTVRRPTRHHAEDRPLLPGETPCPACGTGNDPARRFCRRCGGPLTPAAVVVPPTRWRRLVAWVFPRRVYDAGTRRTARRPISWRRPVLLLAGVLALVTIAATPGLRALPGKGLAAVLDRTSKPAARVPSAARASGSATGTSPERVYDGKSDTYWAPAGPGGWVEVDFAKAFRLIDVIVTPGVSADQKAFVAGGRPAVLTVEVTDGAGRVTRLTWQVRDAPGAQTFPARVSDARRARFTVGSGYGPPDRPAAVAELEFYGR
ncbi:NADase-type glycan-binding domain-containing protein [Longispora urticae]